MRKSTAAALIAILFIAVFMRLLPLLRFVYWGADIGEYHVLVDRLVAAGHLGTGYEGWGKAYPFFPGMYFVVGAGSEIGIGSDASLNLIPPLLNAIAVLLIFLVAVRIFRDDRVGLIAAGVLAVSFPYVYTNSHPIPSAIGSVLFLASLALTVGPSSGKKKILALVPIAAALVITHHLSTYFLILAVLTGLVVKSLLVADFRWRNVSLDAIILAALLAIALPYWLVYATPFRENLLGDLGGIPWWGPFAMLAITVSVWIVFVSLRRRWKWRYAPKFPLFKRSSMTFVAGLVLMFGLIGVFTAVNVVGTSIKIPLQDVLFLSPFLVLVSFAASGRKHLDFARDGHKPTAWVIAFAISLFVGSVFAEKVLVPYRHIDFVMTPAAIMIGAGIALLHDLGMAGRRNGASVAVVVAMLIAGNMAIAYPPQEFMAGYNEGTTAHSLVAISWLPGHVEGLLATDHKASMQAFGFGGTNATWDTARATLFASNFTNARSEMLDVNSPSGHKRVDFVLVNEDVRTGAQMYPWEPASRLSEDAQAKFDGVPYLRLFDDGYSQIYMVNWGLT